MDTNVLVAAFRSDMGASFKLLSLVGDPRWQLNVSTALLFEYEEIVQQVAPALGQTQEEVNDILDYLCAASNQRQVHFLWRPQLRDPDDKFILELAVESAAHFIVTHNRRDFQGCERFGIKAVTPREFLAILGVLK